MQNQKPSHRTMRLSPLEQTIFIEDFLKQQQVSSEAHHMREDTTISSPSRHMLQSPTFYNYYQLENDLSEFEFNLNKIKTKSFSLTPMTPLGGFKLDLQSCEIESGQICDTEFSTPFTKKSLSTTVRDLSSTFNTPQCMSFNSQQLFKVEKNLSKEKSLRKELREFKDQNFKITNLERE